MMNQCVRNRLQRIRLTENLIHYLFRFIFWAENIWKLTYITVYQLCCTGSPFSFSTLPFVTVQCMDCHFLFLVHSARLLEIETAIRQEQSPVSNQFTDKNKTTNSGGIWILVIDVSWYPTSDCGLYIWSLIKVVAAIVHTVSRDFALYETWSYFLLL